MTLTTILAFCVTLSLMVTTGVHGGTCTIKGDPHANSFTGSIHNSLAFPCQYLTAHLKYSFASGDVHVKVYASSGLETFHGRYFVNYAKVVVDDNAGGYRVEFVSTASNINTGSTPWDISVSGTVPAELKYTTEFDAADDTGILNLGLTGQEEFYAKVKFFPRTAAHPADRGVKVRASLDTVSYVSFPDAICSKFNDYSGTSGIPGAYSGDTKMLLAALQQGTFQSNSVCNELVNQVYPECGSTRDTAAAYCYPFLHDHDKAKCLQDPDKEGAIGDSLYAFHSCMKYMCGRSVVDGCDHCTLGPLCDNDGCKTLPALTGCTVDGDCLEAAKCKSGICKLVADLGDSCLGCHRICTSSLTCDETDHVCRLPLGAACSQSIDWCEKVGYCECRTNECRIKVGDVGCGDEDALCDGAAVCDNNVCVAPSSCASGYEEMCGGCLKFLNTKIAFEAAASDCENDVKGGRLVHPKTIAQIACVSNFTDIFGVPGQLLWIGNDDIENEGTYLWHDCTELALGDAIWGPGQPNHWSRENCNALATDSRIHDYACGWNFAFICEHSI